LLAEVGYQRLSYDLVAQRTGATRPTVYLWGSNKVLLVLGALVEHYGIDPTPDTGSLATDLCICKNRRSASGTIRLSPDCSRACSRTSAASGTRGHLVENLHCAAESFDGARA
jgi:hypothetical protein